MIENFLRRPRGWAELLADAVRVLGALSVIAALVGWSATDAGIVALTLPALVAPRFLGVRPGFDIVATLTILVAAWSNVLDLYTTVPGWDLVVHFAATGVLAILVYLLLAHLRIVDAPDRDMRVPIVLTPTIGLAISAVWEMIEWLGKNLVTDDIFVTYDDTIGDMVFGGLGSLVAGCLLSALRFTRR